MKTLMVAALVAITAIFGWYLSASGRDRMELTADAMIGSWRRAAQVSCKTIYPPLVTFMKNGIYAAPDSPDAGAIWHGGDWEIDQDNALRVQAAHDALLKYSVDELSADGFVLVDQDGCRITYSRAT